MSIICHIYSYQRYIVVYVLPVLFLCSYVSNIQIGISLKFILTGFLSMWKFIKKQVSSVDSRQQIGVGRERENSCLIV